MSDWYVSSVSYAAVPVWAANTAYTVGQFIRPLTPATNQLFVFRCTTAGTTGATEPTTGTWAGAAANNATIASGTATFTNVTGQSAYGWSAAAGSLYAISANLVSNRPVVGDRVFVASDHSESFTAIMTYFFNNFAHSWGQITFVSVNRAGSVPPVAADTQSGAAITVTNQSLILDPWTSTYWQGFTFTLAGTSNGVFITFGSSGAKTQYFKNCAFVISNTGVSSGIKASSMLNSLVWDNCTVQFGNVAQSINGSSYPFSLVWLNTPSAIQGATLPTSLFTASGSFSHVITCRGVDLSALVGALTTNAVSGGANAAKVLLDSCRVAAAMTRLNITTVTGSSAADEVELVNCFDGTNVLNERTTAAGVVTTDRSTTLSGGAQDDVGAYSLKMVSAAVLGRNAFPLDGFWLDVENAIVGSPKTATVEVISSASLNNDDLQLMLEYMGTAGSPLASFGNSLATVLTPSAALTTSANTWNNPPSTPVKQLLQVTFTPQVAGRVRGLVRLGKPSTTVWVNPQAAVA